MNWDRYIPLRCYFETDKVLRFTPLYIGIVRSTCSEQSVVVPSVWPWICIKAWGACIALTSLRVGDARQEAALGLTTPDISLPPNEHDNDFLNTFNTSTWATDGLEVSAFLTKYISWSGTGYSFSLFFYIAGSRSRAEKYKTNKQRKPYSRWSCNGKQTKKTKNKVSPHKRLISDGEVSSWLDTPSFVYQPAKFRFPF